MNGVEDRLIERLAGDLRPVRPLAPPVVRALVWLAAVAALGIALAAISDMGAFRTRMADVPDLRCAAVGAALTAIAAAIAAFQISVPGRRPAWMLIPVLPALLWLGASGWGCMRGWHLPWMQPATAQDSAHCALFITAVSIPLSALLLLLLRRAVPLYPTRVAAFGGLAAAAAAASLLCLFHPEDASAIDLIVHLSAVGLVVIGNSAIARGFWRAGRIIA